MTTTKFLQKSLNLLFRRQTNILSAALIIMSTIILSQVLGLVRQRLLVAVYGASNTAGIYLASAKFPDLLFQLIFAGALSSAFIPVFSEMLAKEKQKEAHTMASGLLCLGAVVFFILATMLFIFAPFFLQLINLGSNYTPSEMALMANLMRVIIVSQFLFIIATFFSVLLQSYNHFFIPGIAAATYNLGIIIGILTLSSVAGIYAPAYGMILGALFFILFQLPMVKKVGFVFRPHFSWKIPGILDVFHLMWPRTISIGIFYLGSLAVVSLTSFLSFPGRNYLIFDYAQTLAFAPVVLFGQAIAQAAFPVLAREKDKPEEFKLTFMTSFNQLLYLVLPVSVLILVLRIPIVRLMFGAGLFDWEATVLTGRVLALLSISIFAQALIYLVSRGYYALHDTKTPLIIGTFSTMLMIGLGFLFVLRFDLGVEGIALASSIAGIISLIVSVSVLDIKLKGFHKMPLFISWTKIFLATVFTGIALYVPIKLLDQLVFDTTKTINLLMLTGISSFAGLSIYLFLTWFFNVKEATTYIGLFRKLGNWREILGMSDEPIDTTMVNP